MNKAELVGAIASEANMTKADAKKALDAFIKATSRVSLLGFGTFSVVKRASRTGRNPRTGAEITIAAKRVPQFKPGTELKNFVR